jgi:hypothetical protein
MYIPKNTGVILNCYEIHHNEEKYPDSYAPWFSRLISFQTTDKGVSPIEQVLFQPRTLLGGHVDVFRIEQATQRNGSGPLGIWRRVRTKFVLLAMIGLAY